MSGSTQPVRGVELSRSAEVLQRAAPRFAKVAVGSAVRSYGRRTAGARSLPDYLIIGAKKGGTSSLANWLLQHPEVLRMFPPFQRLKSAHFFDINFHRGVDWYRGHFPARRAFRRESGAVVGEASPYYLFHPAAAARARATVPEAKVIAVLRNPVTRAYSNYWDRVAAGAESLPTFESALAAEEDRLAAVDGRRLVTDPGYYAFAHDHHTYRARGRYLEQLDRWLSEFPSSQVLILPAEEMYADPARTFGQVEDFLGIRDDQSIDLKTYNQRSKPPLATNTRRELAEYYRPYNEALYERLGRDLHWQDERG